MTADTFFEEAIGRGGVPRDDHGNALIAFPGPDGPLVPYTSASSVANVIEYAAHIHTWEKRYLAKGMAISPDLCLLAASEPYNTGLTNPVTGPEKTASGRRLDEIIERALDRVGIHEKADYGTAVHSWTEPGNDAEVAERAKADVDSFWAALKENGVKIGATEVFTVNDRVQAAGTFDHLCWVPGYGWVITDKKTGRLNEHHFATQLAVYATGEVYDAVSRTRAPLESLVDGEPINRNVGVVFEIKNAKTKLHFVDLTVGLAGTIAAAAARDFKATPVRVLDGHARMQQALDDEREAIAQAIRRMRKPTTERLNELYAKHAHLWTETHTLLGRAKLEGSS